ncbi:MAG: FAD-dependent oxidoreductase, partial [Candidatus Margulisbacteria bacterium]|nr:FAD-dependent oxidoreductase [Candidatus Margulisiibacteriota bacterium]
MALQLAVKPQEKEIIIEERHDLDTIIIGGGPAGLTAAIYCLRARLNVVLIEKMILGGAASTTYSIENYPGFPDAIGGLALTEKMSDQAKKLGLNVIWGNVIRAKKKKEHCEVEIDGKTLSAKTLIIATGTEAAKLGIPGEEKFRGRGVSYCATCDGPFYKDKNILVVGGGNAAVEEALFLTRYASKVSI